MDIFLKPKEMAGMAQGLKYFLKRVVSKTNITSNSSNKQTVRWGCKVASDALTVLATQAIANE